MSRPIGAKNKPKEAVPTEPISDVKKVPFTGVARSVECVKQQGYNNFFIVTLSIEDGIVTKRHVSDPYASFETIARMEVQCHQATLNLNQGYEDGKAWRS